MTEFSYTCSIDEVFDKINYDRFMLLKIFVDEDNSENELKNLYISAATKHNDKILDTNSDFIDAGFDLFAPSNNGTTYEFVNGSVNKFDFKVCCSAQMILENGKKYNTGYYMYPRSSLSKTPFRLANSVGIIDSGYRGHIIAMFDATKPYDGAKHERYVQICAPGLVPIIVQIVDTKEELGEKTERGDGGFGSTGR